MTGYGELTALERELVLQYLRDDNVPLTVTLQEKPQPSERELHGKKMPEPRKQSRIPPSALFPVAIPAEQMSVLHEGIILLRNVSREVAPFMGKQVKVQFYFHKLGLYFVTTMQESSKGLAIVVPSSIFRIEDKRSSAAYAVTAKLVYSVQADVGTAGTGSSVEIMCLPKDGYSLFETPKWSDIPVEKHGMAKALLEQFVLEAKKTGVAIGSGLQLISICRYFASPAQEHLSATEGGYKPLDLLFIDEKRLVIAAPKSDERILLQREYTIQLTFTIPGNGALKRTVLLQGLIDSAYSANNESFVCYACTYSFVRKEDTRFLYERLTGKKSA